ncbi:MAG: VWA domain-containing protein [Pseudobacteriovorax sp.]|nr:VWA domain-containing protein [Pseudobacteriovorax sp.]
MTLAYPWLLFLFLPLVILAVLYLRSAGQAGVSFPLVARMGTVGRHPMSHMLPLLRLLTIACLIVAAARPQSVERQTKRSDDGLDILLTIDTSESMTEALPYGNRRVSRLEAVKLVVREFISQRINDRIGLVVFGGEAFTQAPLTLDHDVLKEFVDNIYINMATPGTSIGPAIAVASKRLKDIPSKSKIVILLTDGRDSGRRVNPQVAAEAAAVLGVKIYTVGIGSEAPGGIFGRMLGSNRNNLDEASLTKIAETTGGRYFRADSVEDLSQVYQSIDKLETSKVEVTEFNKYHEEAWYFLVFALFCLCLELLLRGSRWRVVT